MALGMELLTDEPPKDGNIPDFNISKIDICPFRTYQRSFRLFQGISRKIFTSGADCYVSLRMTTLVMLDSKYAPF